MKKQTKKKALIGVGVVGAVGLAAYLLTRPAHAEPPPGLALLYGKVTDADTAQPISGIVASVGDGYTDQSDNSGNYLVQNIQPGTYPVFFTDPLERYEPISY